MKILLLTMSFLFTISMSSYGQKVDPVVKKIIEIGNEDNQTMDHLDVIANRFGGRMVGSDAYENTLDWIAYKFKEWGLEVIIEEAGEVPVGFNRGPWFGKVAGMNGMNLNFVTPSYTSGTKGVAIGHVLIEPKTRDEFNRMKKVMNGAWVLISGTNRGWAIDHGVEADERRAKVISENEEIAKKNSAIYAMNRTNNTNKPLLELKSEPALFYKEMVEAGILGIIQSSKVPMTALYDKNVLNDKEMTLEKLPTTVDIKLDQHQYAEIYQWVKERRNIELEIEIRNHFKMGPIKYHTITGKITGTKYPDEYVMVTGHLDAYDVSTGGVDCGSGMTPGLEAARLIMAADGKPKRSMLFTMFAAEEIGLIGSKAWVANHTKDLENISNLMNRDSGPTVPTGISVPKAMYSDFEGICAPLNTINPDFPFALTVREKPMNKPIIPRGHDGSVFQIEGVPTLGFNLGDTKGYNFSYGEIWHTDRDVYTKSIPEYQEHSAIVTAVVAYGIANLDHLLNRDGLYIDAK